MNREIKFRAWDEKNKWMMYPRKSGELDLLIDLDGTPCVCGEGLGYRKNLILMQYTGLKDKNGKEIYEGDIVKIKEGKAKIEFEDGEFNLKEIDYNLEAPDYFRYRLCKELIRNNHLEVIGNIYENKLK